MTTDDRDRILKELYVNRSMLAGLDAKLTAQMKSSDEHRKWCKDIENRVRDNTSKLDKAYGVAGFIALIVSVGVGYLWDKK